MMKIGRIALLALMSAALVAGLAGCKKKEGPAERVGKAIDKAAEKTGEGIDKAAKKVDEKLEKAGEKVEKAVNELKK